MSNLPTFGEATEAAQDAVDAVRDHGRTLLPWLPDPPTHDCGALMYADWTYDPRQASRVASWHCRECDVHHYRDPEFGDGLVEGPRPGATKLREVFDDHEF